MKTIMAITLLLAITCALAACGEYGLFLKCGWWGAESNECINYRELHNAPRVETSSSGRTVEVWAGVPDIGVEKALALANTECAKRGLTAHIQVVTLPTHWYTFECVLLGT